MTRESGIGHVLATNAEDDMGNVPPIPAGKETPTDASGPVNPAVPGPPVPPAADASQASGAEPDARFTFANERTFLAWIRTALALVAAGLAIVQLLPPFHGIHWGRRAIGMPLILLGAVVAVVSYIEWDANQRALRRGDPPRHSRLPLLLAVIIALVALAAAVLALVSG
jgi:putative membrane protein